jgi:hypothetical protein
MLRALLGFFTKSAARPFIASASARAVISGERTLRDYGNKAIPGGSEGEIRVSEAVLTRNKDGLLIRKDGPISISQREKHDARRKRFAYAAMLCAVFPLKKIASRNGEGTIVSARVDDAVSYAYIGVGGARMFEVMRLCNGLQQESLDARLHAGLPAWEASEAASRLFRQEGSVTSCATMR